MFIKDLSLINFRNYKELSVSFHKGSNIIHGLNGQGKTNILEAIFLCATGKSHRASRDLEMIKYNQDCFNIKLNLINNIGDKEINISYNKDRQKVIKVNEICLRKMGNLMGHLNAVIFSPEDLQIVKQGPSIRRRFVDLAMSQIKSSHYFNLQHYNKVLSQRNALLKQAKYKRSLIPTIDVWNESLAKVGAAVEYQRMTFVKVLSELVYKKHKDLSNGKENLTLKYKSSILPDSSENAITKEDIYNVFLLKLSNNIQTDIEREYTSFGPHRDDIIYLINGVELKLYGSQGQQRTAVLASKLAELDIMEQETGQMPVLLLDDVLSELDNDRQEYLFNRLDNIQTFITCTDKNMAKNMLNSNASFYCVSDGFVIP